MALILCLQPIYNYARLRSITECAADKVSAEIGCFPQLSPANLDIGRLVALREVNLPAQSL
jgi:hypothetical protein